MRETLNTLDTDLFLWLNGLHAAWLDPIMVWVTTRNSWFPFYVLLIGWIVFRYRRKALGLLLTIAAAVAIGDQITSSALKPLTHRLRPCHTPALQKLIHPVLECGGLYGFASSHAATTFALATSLWLLLGERHPWLKVWFIWAALVTYSRIYVGAHYPLDILAGTGCGLLAAAGSVYMYRKAVGKFGRRSV